MFNEGDFERAAYHAHDELGAASPATIDRMLQSYGFQSKWGMRDAENVHIDLIKLADGARLLRFTDRTRGSRLSANSMHPFGERKKRQLGEVFAAAVARAQLAFT